jgi:RNA polymerase sigma-B factor
VVGYRQNYDLLLDYQTNRSRRLRTQIFKINKNLIHTVIQRMGTGDWRSDYEYEDLYQVGSIGLLYAIDRFSPDNGSTFSSFAFVYIRGEILHYFRDKCSIVKKPREVFSLHRRGVKFSASYFHDTGRKPSPAKIAGHLSISVGEWSEVLAGATQAKSLDAPIAGGSGTLLVDTLVSSDKETIEFPDLAEMVNTLPPREAFAVREHYLKDRTIRSIAKEYGMSEMTLIRAKRSGIRLLRVLLD